MSIKRLVERNEALNSYSLPFSFFLFFKKDSTGETALAKASDGNHFEMIKLLVHHGANLNEKVLC
jgi:ankyrin repeat protein